MHKEIQFNLFLDVCMYEVLAVYKLTSHNFTYIVVI